MHIVFLCLEAILMGAPYAVPAIPPLLGAAMFWAGTIGLAATLLWVGLSRTQLKNKLSFWRSTEDDLIGFTEAARLMYELASPELKQTMRGPNETNNSIVDYGRSALLIAGGQGVIRLYGRRGEGLVRELIPQQELENDLHPHRQGGDAIGGITIAGDPHYIDVAVHHSEVPRAAAAFENDHDENRD